MLGLMQDWPMTVDRILDHADRWHGDREVISRSVEGPIVRTTWSRIHSRARQVTHALKELGIQPGDRVATLGWNTARHIETWYGVMGMGAVCHTLNPRLHPDQIMWIASHAGDRILFTDLTFLPMLLEHLHKAPCIERVVILSDEAHRPDGAGAEMFMYEDLIAGRPTAAMDGMDFETQLPILLKQGRPPLGIDIKLVNDTDESLPRDGATFGRLLVKGPTVVQAYFRGAAAAADAEGYFDTGDVATIDTHGFMQITDRAKDVIKSGGEWISSIDIENIAAGHPKAALAAVIGVYHPKWDERPLLLVKLKDGVTATRQEFLDFLAGKIAKWWTPDDVVFVDDIPLGATGKIDKKVLRQRFGDYVLPTIHPYTAKEEAVGEPE